MLTLSGAAAFVIVASVFQPFGSNAGVEPAGAADDAQAVSTAASPIEHRGERRIGELVGPEYRVVVTASSSGPLYTVVASDGTVKAADLTRTELARDFPALAIETMTADVTESSPIDR